MSNSSPDLFSDITNQFLGGWLWGIISLIAAAIISLYFSRQTKKDIDDARNYIEKCLDGRITSNSQKEPLACKKVEKYAKKLQSAASNYDRGISKTALNDLDGAYAEFSAAIEQHMPMLSECYFQRGNTRYFQKRFKDSCADYSEAIKIDHQFVAAWVNKGAALGKLGRHDEALKAFDEALEIDPKDAQTWYNKGAALDKLGLT